MMYSHNMNDLCDKQNEYKIERLYTFSYKFICLYVNIVPKGPLISFSFFILIILFYNSYIIIRKEKKKNPACMCVVYLDSLYFYLFCAVFMVFQLPYFAFEHKFLAWETNRKHTKKSKKGDAATHSDENIKYTVVAWEV